MLLVDVVVLAEEDQRAPIVEVQLGIGTINIATGPTMRRRRRRRRPNGSPVIILTSNESVAWKQRRE